MYEVVQGQAFVPLVFALVSSTDHVTPLTGAVPAVTLAKNGIPGFATAVGAVAEIGAGWYKVLGNPLDSSNAGPLLLHATAAGADPADTSYLVVPLVPCVPSVCC
jgi:hypothetical protein